MYTRLLKDILNKSMFSLFRETPKDISTVCKYTQKTTNDPNISMKIRSNTNVKIRIIYTKQSERITNKLSDSTKENNGHSDRS